MTDIFVQWVMINMATKYHIFFWVLQQMAQINLSCFKPNWQASSVFSGMTSWWKRQTNFMLGCETSFGGGGYYFFFFQNVLKAPNGCLDAKWEPCCVGSAWLFENDYFFGGAGVSTPDKHGYEMSCCQLQVAYFYFFFCLNFQDNPAAILARRAECIVNDH